MGARCRRCPGSIRPDRLDDLIRNRGIHEVILSIPSADALRRTEIVAELSRFAVKIRALPAITDLVAGKYLVNQLREIDIDDLLGRPGVPADPELMRQMLAGKVILVTGAGGSIGSELTRLIIRRKPQKLVLLEANEFALYEIERRLKAMADDVPVVPVLGHVGDAALVRRTLAMHAVDVIFHTAAHKHVPLLEDNVLEGVRNNVLGTRALVEAAVAENVPRFVLISTDKAVRPSSVMGATKRWAELIVRHYGQSTGNAGRRYCAVRFGNVLGSNGSVVPLFREQIQAGGPVTLTDARMTRYFMSIHEAAELIVQAGAMAEGGDIFLLDMGKPVAIRDLAENMIRLAGLTVKSEANPGGDYRHRRNRRAARRKAGRRAVLRSRQRPAHRAAPHPALAAGLGAGRPVFRRPWPRSRPRWRRGTRPWCVACCSSTPKRERRSG